MQSTEFARASLVPGRWINHRDCIRDVSGALRSDAAAFFWDRPRVLKFQGEPGASTGLTPLHDSLRLEHEKQVDRYTDRSKADVRGRKEKRLAAAMWLATRGTGSIATCCISDFFDGARGSVIARMAAPARGAKIKKTGIVVQAQPGLGEKEKRH